MDGIGQYIYHGSREIMIVKNLRCRVYDNLQAYRIWYWLPLSLTLTTSYVRVSLRSTSQIMAVLNRWDSNGRIPNIWSLSIYYIFHQDCHHDMRR